MGSNKLGDRIKTYREKNGLSIEELAQRTGFDISFIEAVEEQDLYPSLGPLLKISRTLGVRLGTFMDDDIGHDPLIILQKDRKESMSMHTNGDKAASHTYYSLGRGKTDRHMEPFHIVIAPGGEDKSLSTHEGEEFIYVLKGQVELLYGKQQHVLEAGDSLYINSVMPHYVGNPGAEPAEICAVLYFPED